MGDGGLLVTDDDDVAARCRRLRDHGRTSKDVHVEVGFNLRFNDIQAAVGRVLLRRLDAMNDKRRRLAARYAAGLAGLPLVLPSEAPGAHHVYHLYVVATPERDRLAAFLKDRGIATGIHYPVPCHQQPAVEYLAPGPLEHTERIVKQILTLPISAGHTENRRSTRSWPRCGPSSRSDRTAPSPPALPEERLLHRRRRPAPRALPRPPRPRPSRGRGHAIGRGVGGEVRGGRPSLLRRAHALRARRQVRGPARAHPEAPPHPDRPRSEGPRANSRHDGEPLHEDSRARPQPGRELSPRRLQPSRLHDEARHGHRRRLGVHQARPDLARGARGQDRT